MEEDIKKAEKLITASTIANSFLEGYQLGLKDSQKLTKTIESGNYGMGLAWLLGGNKPKSRVLSEWMDKNFNPNV